MAARPISERSCNKWEVFSFLLMFEMAKREVKRDPTKDLCATFDETLSRRLGLIKPLEKKQGTKAA